MTQQTTDASIEYGLCQHIGSRPNLEDRMAARHLKTADGTPLTVAIVADGIGGSNFGERASELTVQLVLQEIQAGRLESPSGIPELLALALTRANDAVVREARRDKEKEGMGSTATVAAVYRQKLYLANVGDSRAYLVRDGSIHQLTQDHTWAREMVLLGRLSPEDAAKHPKAEELVRSIGYDTTVEVDLGIYRNSSMDEQSARRNQGLPLQPGDRLVLCSDGLIKTRHDGPGHYVEEPEIVQMMARYHAEDAAKALVKKATDRRTDDNVTAVVLEVPGGKPLVAAGLPKAVYVVAAVLSLLLILAVGYWLTRGDEPVTASEPTNTVAAVIVENTATLMPLVIPSIEVEQDTVVLVTADGQTSEIPITEALTRWQSGEVRQILFPNNTQLFLGSDTEVEIKGITGLEGETQTYFTIHQGIVVVATMGQPVEVKNPVVGKGRVVDGVMGVRYGVSPFVFEVSCLDSEACVFEGDSSRPPLTLNNGQQSLASADGNPTTAQPVRYEQWFSFAPPVPTPTPTPVPTGTPTATATPTATNTRRPATAVPTSTFTPTSPGTTAESATPPPQDETPGSPGNTPVPPPPTAPGSTPAPDRDGDGVPDDQDSCPNESGPASNGGCPVPPAETATTIPPPAETPTTEPPGNDRDGDGIPDDQDACPNQPGPGGAGGCPDGDGDGVPDGQDRCDDLPGPPENDGCPDSDGDGIPDDRDNCPNEPGPVGNNGCPVSPVWIREGFGKWRK